MKHIPPLTVTPVTVEIVRRDDSRFADILSITCGETNVFLEIGDRRHAQRYWNRASRTSSWVVTNDMFRDYTPISPSLITADSISEVHEVEQGPEALGHVREIWADCPAVRPLLAPILRLFR